MLRACLIFVIAIACIVASFRPASADVSVHFAVVGSTNITARCPVTVNFGGTIFGPPGTPVVYHSAHYVNGVWTYGNDTQGTITDNGVLVESERLIIDSAHAGFQSFQLNTTQPNASEGKVYFTVTCATYDKGVSTPTLLTRSTDSTDCAKHVSGLLQSIAAAAACKAALDQGKVILLWQWSLYPCVAKTCLDAQGYHVYAVNTSSRMVAAGGSTGPQLLDTRSADVTLSTPVSGKCYAVTAYNGSVESPLSNVVCAGSVAPGTAMKRDFLKPVHANYSETNKLHDSGYLDALAVGQANFGSALVVGYAYLAWTHATGDSYNNTYWRSALQFDLSPFRGHVISRALLHLNINGTAYQPVDGQQVTDGGRSCTIEIGTGVADWWNQPQNVAFGGDFSNAINTGGQRGPSLAYDVTSLARSWSEGAINQGMVLRNTDENLGAFTNAMCETTYSGAELEVDHY